MNKQRAFPFTADKVGKLDFRLCYEAFRGRDPQKCTGPERQHLAILQREFERLSHPMGEQVDDDLPDLRMRTLKPEGGTLTVPVKVFERLETYVDETPFMAGLSMQVEDLKERLTVAPKVDDKVTE